MAAEDESNTVIQVEDLTMAYSDQPVLVNCNINFEKGSRTAIIGPNGAGKSTLIKGILGLEKPLIGRVLVEGQPFEKVRADVAYIPQTSSVNWDFPTTVLDVVVMGRYVHLGWLKRPKKTDKEKAMQALEEMGMVEYADRQISELSGGQRQRVFIARAICQDANIYLMDEPFAGVDKGTEKSIVGFMKKVQGQGKTSIVVHHDMNTLTQYFDHLVILNKRVIAQGKMEDVLTQENLEEAEMGGFYVG